MRKVVIYSGRFQPMLGHHAQVYKALTRDYPQSDVYLGTSDKVEQPKSPFNFIEKRSLITLHGVPQDHVLKVKSPYNWQDYTEYFSPDNTILIFILGPKDAERLTSSKTDPDSGLALKRDGTPAHIQDIKHLEDDPQPMSRRVYVKLAPKISDEQGQDRSASAFREKFKSAPSDKKAKEIFTQEFGGYDESAFHLVNRKLRGNNSMNEHINRIRTLAGLSEAAPIHFGSEADPSKVKFTSKPATGTGPDEYSISKRFPPGADVTDPDQRKDQFLKELTTSPNALLGEINSRLDPRDENSLEVGERLSNVMSQLDDTHAKITSLNSDDRNFVIKLVAKAIKDLEISEAPAASSEAPAPQEEEEPKESLALESFDLNYLRTLAGLPESAVADDDDDESVYPDDEDEGDDGIDWDEEESVDDDDEEVEEGRYDDFDVNDPIDRGALELLRSVDPIEYYADRYKKFDFSDDDDDDDGDGDDDVTPIQRNIYHPRVKKFDDQLEAVQMDEAEEYDGHPQLVKKLGRGYELYATAGDHSTGDRHSHVLVRNGKIVDGYYDTTRKVLAHMKWLGLYTGKSDSPEEMPMPESLVDLGDVLENYGIRESEPKPDYLDLDHDGDTQEPMKKAAKDAEEGDEGHKQSADESFRSSIDNFADKIAHKLGTSRAKYLAKAIPNGIHIPFFKHFLKAAGYPLSTHRDLDGQEVIDFFKQLGFSAPAAVKQKWIGGMHPVDSNIAVSPYQEMDLYFPPGVDVKKLTQVLNNIYDRQAVSRPYTANRTNEGIESTTTTAKMGYNVEVDFKDEPKTESIDEKIQSTTNNAVQQALSQLRKLAGL